MDLDKMSDIIDKFNYSYDCARNTLYDYAVNNVEKMKEKDRSDVIFALNSIDAMTKNFVDFAREVLEEEKRRCPNDDQTEDKPTNTKPKMPPLSLSHIFPGV